jgi:glycosyltransferase involved in cell wall biosynthesis
MKLLFHDPHHHKNMDGIRLMTQSRGIELEFTRDDSRVFRFDYDIVILNARYLDLDRFPPHIKVICGPQFWVFPSGPIVGPQEPRFHKRCAYNSLSKWVEVLYREMAGDLRIPIAQFPFAVDVEKFKPSGEEKTLDCILYAKLRDQSLVNSIAEKLKARNLSFKIYSYTRYTEEEYLKDLRRSKFMVVCDRHESQGFALQEAMSCDVPLLVLDATTMYDEIVNGAAIYESCRPKKLLSTCVPYFSDTCGIKINAMDEFDEALTRMCLNYRTFNPRDYILETLSPAVCMDRILTYFEL